MGYELNGSMQDLVYRENFFPYQRYQWRMWLVPLCLGARAFFLACASGTDHDDNYYGNDYYYYGSSCSDCYDISYDDLNADDSSVTVASQTGH